eukprot:g3484.t1
MKVSTVLASSKTIEDLLEDSDITIKSGVCVKRQLAKFSNMAGGSKCMIVDEVEDRFLYKEQNDDNCSERVFYEGLNEESVSDSMRGFRDLQREEIIAKYYGGARKGSKNFMKLERFCKGMAYPHVIDVKLGDMPVGSFPSEPYFRDIELTKREIATEDISSALSKYRHLKHTRPREEIRDISPSDIGLRCDPTSLRAVMKYYAQREAISNSCAPQLGFRVAGIISWTSLGIDDDMNATTLAPRRRRQRTGKSVTELWTVERTVASVADFLGGDGAGRSEIASRARSVLRDLASIEDFLTNDCSFRIYASSILLIFDAQNQTARAHWVDFAHVHRVKMAESPGRSCLRGVRTLQRILFRVSLGVPCLVKSVACCETSMSADGDSRESRALPKLLKRRSPRRIVAERIRAHSSESDKSKEGDVSNSISCANASGTKRNRLKLVIVVHRHGARIPTKSDLPLDLSWPCCEQFYSNYSANLTPEGSFQAYQLGSSFAERYLYDLQLLADVNSWQYGDFVRVHTSNRHRTLFTSWSLLRGMFVDSPIYFSYREDRLHVTRAAVEGHLRKFRRTMGIPIIIENQQINDELMHQIKTASKEAQNFKKTNFRKSAFMRDLDCTKKWSRLADKMFDMTGDKSFGPSHDLIDRVSRFKKVVNRLSISRSHRNIVEIPNPQNLSIDAHDEALLQEAGKCFWKYMFRPASSDRVEDGIGEESAGHLAGDIARYMEDRISGDADVRFVEFSSHDTTLLALASFLGVDVPRPQFCAYWAFELYEEEQGEACAAGAPGKGCGDSSTTASSSSKESGASKWFVRVKFDPDPCNLANTKDAYDVTRSIQLPLNGTYVGLKEVPSGDIDASALIRYMADSGTMEASAHLRRIAFERSRVSSSKTWSDVLTLDADITDGPSNDGSSEKFKDAFDFYDRNHDGVICATELASVFRDLGIKDMPNEDIDGLVEFVTRCSTRDGGREDDPPTTEKSLTFDDFLKLMRLVSKSKGVSRRSMRRFSRSGGRV